MFSHQLVLRVHEMLRVIRRDMLPGVKRTEHVKTHGTLDWQPEYPVRRLLVPRQDADFGRSAAHAVCTLLQGSKGQRVSKTEADAAVISTLSVHAPVLTDEQVSSREADSGALVAALRVATRTGRRRVVAAAAANENVPEDGPDDIAEAPEPAGPVVVDVPVEEAPLDTAPLASMLSMASASSGTASSVSGYCESDDTVSECDSRSDATDESDAGGSEAATDPYGCSPEPWISDDEGDDPGKERAHSPACGSGSGCVPCSSAGGYI